MSVTVDPAAVRKTTDSAVNLLLAARDERGVWPGRLADSALATATALFALATAGSDADAPLIDRGRRWLCENQNRDGGWGDTVLSQSNLATTALVWAALNGVSDEASAAALARAHAWLEEALGELTPAILARALRRRYGKDQSFSAPILTMCALAGRLGPNPWRFVPQLPFELAVLPREFWRRLRMPVVSYALPALIAMGIVRHDRRPGSAINPIGLIRRAARPRALAILEHIAPPSGGFLEAQPLTAFVVMSLAAAGHRDHPVVPRGLEFLRHTARPNGAWPIDTSLATWTTTLAVKALAAGGRLHEHLELPEIREACSWLTRQQHRVEHPYTGAAPGGWAWTDLPGAVPDADDTAGVLLATMDLCDASPRRRCKALTAAGRSGILWLTALQNRDGGIPTFCRGWGRLDFDRSAPDLTAHAIAAWSRWHDTGAQPWQAHVRKAMRKALGYLHRARRPDGAWLPLWFGSELAPDQANPVYGTSQVLAGLLNAPELESDPRRDALIRGAVDYLLAARHRNGGWGGAPGLAPTIEETAVALDALLQALLHQPVNPHCAPLLAPARAAVEHGIAWLVQTTNHGAHFPPAPIGLYFARLWYYESLYPLVFAVAALERYRAYQATLAQPEHAQSAHQP